MASLELDSQFKPADSAAGAPAASTLPEPQQGAGVTSTCCHAEFPYGGIDGEARPLRCTDEAGETTPERHSVGATCVQRFKETTGLEKHKSHSLRGHTTAMMLVFLLGILRTACSVQEINRLDGLSWQLRSLVDITCWNLVWSCRGGAAESRRVVVYYHLHWFNQCIFVFKKLLPSRSFPGW